MMIEKLKNKVEDLILNSEYDIVKIKGISLTRSDLETISMFCDILKEKGNLNGYMVLGEVREIFEKYNII